MKIFENSKVAIAYQLFVSQNNNEIYLVTPNLEKPEKIIKLHYESLKKAIEVKEAMDADVKLTAFPQTSTPIIS